MPQTNQYAVHLAKTQKVMENQCRMSGAASNANRKTEHSSQLLLIVYHEEKNKTAPSARYKEIQI